LPVIPTMQEEDAGSLCCKAGPGQKFGTLFEK
jgi:hypothetical protein